MTTPIQIPFIGKVKHPSKWFIGLLSAGILVSASTYWAINRQATPKLDIASLTVPVVSSDVTLRISASGKVVPVQSVNLSPKNSGVLAQLLVEQGDKVEQGQIIARMDDSNLQAQLSKARANLAQVRAQLAEARAGTRPEEIAQSRARLNQSRAQLNQARTGNRPEEIAQAQAQVEAARARVNLTSSRVQRNRNLATSGAISQDTLDEVIADDRSAKATLLETQRRLIDLKSGSRTEEIDQKKAAVTELEQALQQLQNGSRPEQIDQFEASVAAAGSELKAVQVQLDDTIIRAPFSGIITQKYATVGAFVTPTTSASNTASATSSSIVAVSRGLEVLAQVPEVDIGQVKQGRIVEIVADAYPNQVFKGKVRLISPEAVVEQNVTSFQVRVILTTGQEQLKSGMNVDLTIVGAVVQDALVVPTAAIVTDKKGQTGVLIPDDKKQARFSPVEIGSAIKDKTQIVSGVKTGDRIFLSPPPNYKLDGKN
ncbi:efflux RND transporter periplasmic adaptor subunit [Chlorogloea sp. CCALA 695]|uniref:efflux RND transporter periplasmic adaptor subunit n=1 Tax=Chlorogloea sp. CCALA 695 TaxID=2107693 RepID=UPI000D06AA26|nr:efflux RND transporter periplasmic adaptor subunit [Chlorogloea sp. CCALA 695]PSB35512.1 efflux transporter periplasmic adaptor subunit [Chlorogloea sp. CCALA 695]